MPANTAQSDPTEPLRTADLPLRHTENGASADPEPDDGGLAALAEVGIATTVKAPERADSGFEKMTEAARSVWLRSHGLPLREGSYTTVKNGEPVEIGLSDADTLATCCDLLQMLPAEYAGSPSIDSTRIQSTIANLQAGKPLSAQEWQVFRDLENRFGSQLAEWRANGRDGQDARLRENSGRVSEAESATDLLKASDANADEADLRDYADAHGMTLREAVVAVGELGLLDSASDADPLEALRESGVVLKAAD